MREKYWQKLLIEWRNQGNDGLTIPYIIGSQQFLQTSSNQTINDLILDIVHNDQIQVYLTYCQTVNSLILGYRDESKKQIKGSFPNCYGKPQSMFYLSSFLTDLGDEVEIIIERLREKFQECIELRKYSINHREWGRYTQSEIDFMNRCFADPL